MLTMTKRNAAGTVAAAAMALGALVPAAVAGPTIVGRQLQETRKSPTIVAVALAANADEEGPFYQQLDTLIAAVLAADPAVLAYLQGNGQRTVFAPTDAAFEALGLTPANIGTALTQEDLTRILLYHVARGNRDAAEVTASSRIRTLEGGFLLQAGGVLTDARGRAATIIATDVPAGNGIIHVIDAVVLPAEE